MISPPEERRGSEKGFSFRSNVSKCRKEARTMGACEEERVWDER